MHDTLRFLRKLTLRRLWNMGLVVTSYYVTRLLRRPIQWGYPITLSIEPTTACNLRCPECPSGLRAFTRDTGNLREDFFRNILQEVSRDVTCLIFYFQGEPYIHPRFLDMVHYAHEQGLYTMTSTNGHFLDDVHARRTVESGLDRLIISIDGTTQQVYEQYRIGGKLEKVLEGARHIVRWKKALGSRSPHVVFQFLVVKPNEHQISEVYRLAREIGADAVHLKTAQVYDYEHGNALIPEQNRYARYQQRPDGTWAPKHALSAHCWKLWHAAVITWDGWVVPCCFDKDARHRLGHLRQNSFQAIWQSADYQSFRQKLLTGRQHIDICENCTEGCRVFV